MVGALVKAMIVATFLILAPIIILVCIGLGMSMKALLLMLAVVLPFVCVGLVYGYLAGLEA